MKWKPARPRTAVLFPTARKRGSVRLGLRIGGAAGLAVAAGGLAAGCSAAAGPVAAGTVPAASAAATATASAPFVYVANKSTNNVSQLGSAPGGSGALELLTPKTVASGDFPTGSAVSPQGNSLYVTNTEFPGGPAATVSQYSINPATGKLTPKSPARVATGTGPTAIAVSPDGKTAYVAAGTTGTGTISQYRISPATGKLTPLSPAAVADPGGVAQEGTIKVSPDGKYLYVANAVGVMGTRGQGAAGQDHARAAAGGGGNNIVQYRISAGTGALSSKPVATVPAGGSPESLTIAPDGKSAYLTEPVPKPGSKTGKIAQFSISPATGKLSPMAPATVTTGPGPHDIAITPDSTNAYVLTVLNNTVSQYRISPATGALSPAPVATAATVQYPEAIVMAPGGQNVYATSEHDGALSQYAISPGTGKITSLSPATAATGAVSGSLGLAATPAADLATHVTAPATARPGQTLTYTLTITDTGPSDAWQTAVTGHLPAGTAFRTATTTSGTCSHPRAGTRGATLTCHLSKLHPGRTWHIKVSVTVTASTGTIHANATSASITPDPRHSNNTTSTATKITR